MTKETPSKHIQKEEEIVFPSHKIGIEEQFLPSKESTFVEDHEVKAAIAGKLFIDKEKYRARVLPLHKVSNVPSKRDTVIGQVIKVSRSSMRISVGYINDKPVNPTYSAIMHISDSSRDYIKDLDDFYTSGDIIRATIIDAKTYPIQLECKRNNLGVIYTTCIKCGGKVDKIKKNLLKCEECGWKQSRATTTDFGKVSFQPKY